MFQPYLVYVKDTPKKSWLKTFRWKMALQLNGNFLDCFFIFPQETKKFSLVWLFPLPLCFLLFSIWKQKMKNETSKIFLFCFFVEMLKILNQTNLVGFFPLKILSIVWLQLALVIRPSVEDGINNLLACTTIEWPFTEMYYSLNTLKMKNHFPIYWWKVL